MSDLPWLEPARQTLFSLRRRGAHGLLLHGPAGTGKWELALSFARDILCENAQPPARACGQCPSCHLNGAGSHPDLRVLVPDALAERRPGGSSEDAEAAPVPAEPTGTGKAKPSREIKIDQVRDIASLTEISAHRGGARVVVLGPVEALNAAAANALLKGLEEPPPQTVFLLVADQLDACLPTVISRCSLVRVPVPPRAQALAWLQEQGMGDEAPERLTLAGGAPLAALRGASEALSEDMRASLLGLLRRGAALSAADIAAQVPRTVPIGEAVALFQRWGWDYLAFRLGAPVRYHPGDTGAFGALARAWEPGAVLAWLDTLRALRAVAEHPLNARSAVEGVLLAYLHSLSGEPSQPFQRIK